MQTTLSKKEQILKTYFIPYTRKEVIDITNIRRFETKLGEKIQVAEFADDIEKSLSNSTARFVIVGVPEDLGVKANYGVGGANTAWAPFLQSFLNIQSNDFLDGSNILLLGQYDFKEVSNLIESNAHGFDEKIDAYRHSVYTVDEAVEPLIKLITQYNKIPIVIGGGHNNSYPIIRGAAKGLYKAGLVPLASINCINLDAHADFRPLEGRHSGNGFSYAEEDGYLQKYCVIGVHENYITQNIWMDVVNNPFIDIITYEDIFIHEKRNFLQAVAHATGFTEDTYTGIELDLDCIEDTLTSASTPSGVAPLHARQYVSFTGIDTKTAYLHICEGACNLTDGRTNHMTGKLISYLVSDFIKAKEA
jgi:formiminoglutamase